MATALDKISEPSQGLPPRDFRGETFGIAPRDYRDNLVLGLPGYAPDVIVLRFLVLVCAFFAIASVIIFFVGLVRRLIAGKDALKKRLANDQIIASIIAFIAAVYLSTSRENLSDFFVRAGLLAVVGALGNGYKSKVSPKGSAQQRFAHVLSLVCILLVPVCVFIWWWLVAICRRCLN